MLFVMLEALNNIYQRIFIKRPRSCVGRFVESRKGANGMHFLCTFLDSSKYLLTGLQPLKNANIVSDNLESSGWYKSFVGNN